MTRYKDPTKPNPAKFATSLGKILTILLGPNQYGAAKCRPQRTRVGLHPPESRQTPIEP